MRNLVASSIRRWRLPLAPNLASADGASEQIVATCYDAESRVTYAVTDACNLYGVRDSARAARGKREGKGEAGIRRAHVNRRVARRSSGAHASENSPKTYLFCDESRCTAPAHLCGRPETLHRPSARPRQITAARRHRRDHGTMMLRLLATVATAKALQASTQPHPLFALSQSNTPKPVNKVLSGDLDVNPKELVNMLPLQPSDRKRAKEALSRDDFVVTLDGVVTQEHCDRLITFAKWAMPSTVTGAASNEVDSVDGAPAHQANLPKAALKELLGSEGYARLLAPASQILGVMPRAVDTDGARRTSDLLETFVQRDGRIRGCVQPLSSWYGDRQLRRTATYWGAKYERLARSMGYAMGWTPQILSVDALDEVHAALLALPAARQLALADGGSGGTPFTRVAALLSRSRNWTEYATYELLLRSRHRWTTGCSQF